MTRVSISDGDGAPQAPRVAAALHAVTMVLVLRKTAVVLVAALLFLIGIQSACITALAGRAPRRLYVPESTLLTSTIIEEESNDD